LNPCPIRQGLAKARSGHGSPFDHTRVTAFPPNAKRQRSSASNPHAAPSPRKKSPARGVHQAPRPLYRKKSDPHRPLHYRPRQFSRRPRRGTSPPNTHDYDSNVSSLLPPDARQSHALRRRAAFFRIRKVPVRESAANSSARVSRSIPSCATQKSRRLGRHSRFRKDVMLTAGKKSTAGIRRRASPARSVGAATWRGAKID